MSLVDVATAKLHLRVSGSDEDALITLWLATAEAQVARFLNRNVYADQGTLDTAVAAAPAALSTATSVHDDAIAAAYALSDPVERAAATKYADEAYARSQDDADLTQRGMVVNDSVKAAILLAVGNLYEHRGSDADELPMACRSLLAPYRVGMGV